MANSAKPGPQGTPTHHHHRHRKHTGAVPPKALPPAKTPGTQGRNDQHDPTITTLLGWTPNLTGFRDWVDHTWQSAEKMWQDYTHTPGGVAVDPHTQAPVSTGAKPPVTDDLDLSYLGDFVGGEVSKADIEAAAADLRCDASSIYAIARQESAHSSFITVGGRKVPTILYERHWFRKLTSPHQKPPSPYDADHHEICGPAYHRTEKNKQGKIVDKITQVAPVDDDIYGPSGLHQYQRVTKAYRLDKSAALQACSWGKFQIMGFNFKAAGFNDVFAFVKAMSTGDPAHIKAFLKFAKSNPVLLDGLRTKNYEKIAEGHNGASWRSVNPEYATNLEKFAKEYK
jgi:hypothetical protein